MFVCIQITLHGDGVPVSGIGKSWGRSVLFLSWCSLLATGNTLDFNFLIAGLYEKLCAATRYAHTWNRFCRMLVWSLHWLYLGLWPTEDYLQNKYTDPNSIEFQRAGAPLAGGYFVFLFGLRGDLDYFGKWLKLNHFRAAEPCILCMANERDKPWTDFRKGLAVWMNYLWSNSAWKAAHPQHNIIFCLAGVGILSVLVDIMHTKHLGTDSYFHGSVLKYLTHDVMPDTPERNLEASMPTQTVYKCNI